MKIIVLYLSETAGEMDETGYPAFSNPGREPLVKPLKKDRPDVSFSRHSLFHVLLPAGGVRRILQVHPGEGRLLIWVTVIQVVMSASSILVNNVAQTTFLKRFGAEALPMVFMGEALITFFFAGGVVMLMERFRNIRVFTGLLLFYGLAMGVIRILISSGMSGVYPALYILKSQAVGILPILYWDILNDMFTTQQSKRLYTLISAGGILGSTLGSLMTRNLSLWIGTDNILLIFIGGMILAAVLNELTETITRIPSQLRVRHPRPAAGKDRRERIKTFAAYLKQSDLLKYLVLLLAIPNVLLPILDFQFNILVDRHFASEGATLHFFGIFRGVSNAVMFILLMVSSRLITRLGIPASLLFHPANYCLAFGAMLVQFNIFAGVYARFSTEMLKTVLNNPARAVLYNFFPEKHRSMIRLMLRGGVVRAADFAGSGLLVVVGGIIDPRLLSLVALPFALVWMVTAFRLKNAYPDILIRFLRQDRTDFKQMADEQLQILSRDAGARQFFENGLASGDERTVRLCLAVLSRTTPAALPQLLLKIISDQVLAIQEILLGSLNHDNAYIHRDTLYALARTAPPLIRPAWLETLVRIDPEGCGTFMAGYLDHPDDRVRAEAYTGVCLNCTLDHLDTYRRKIDEWLSGDRFHQRLALKILAGTGDRLFAEKMEAAFLTSPDTASRAYALTGLAEIRHDRARYFIRQARRDASFEVRTAALSAYRTGRLDLPAADVAAFLADPDSEIRIQAAAFLGSQGSGIAPVLLRSMVGPSTLLREEAALLLKRIGIPESLLSRTILDLLTESCRYLSCADALADATPDSATGLLRDCLREKHMEMIEISLRIMGITAFDDRMRVILSAVQSGKRRDIDNVIEALEGELHYSLRNALIPLLQEGPARQRLSRAYRALNRDPLFPDSFETVYQALAGGHEDPAVVLLCVFATVEHPASFTNQAIMRLPGMNPANLAADDHTRPFCLFGRAAGTLPDASQIPAIVRDIFCLKGHLLFSGLSTRDLLAAARLCRIRELHPGQALAHPGKDSQGVALFCQDGFIPAGPCVPGATAQRLLRDTCGFCGEMPWIDGQPEIYTITAGTRSRVFDIPGKDFVQFLKDCPLAAVNLCRFYCREIRTYQEALAHRHENPKEPE
ncbi:MAG: Npt1/Npt2 family nucleotide transporter [Desulfotignum sp.]|nr:Npt1/Npt2 family nucleotide transporter [Desulfotignum sp.]